MLRWLPHLNAILNALSATLLISGFAAVRRRNIAIHKRCMLAAFASSSLFLSSYLTHQYLKGGPTPYPGTGWTRIVYFSILISHTVLAALVPPLSIITLALAFRGRLEKHKRLARWTLPIWLYVSVTGVVVYLMLYQL